MLQKAGSKYPDHLADSCKRSSVNWMAAGLRLSWCIMDFFSCLQLFKHTVQSSTSLAGCRTWCPTDLQHLCCKALMNKNKNINFWVPQSANIKKTHFKYFYTFPCNSMHFYCNWTNKWTKNLIFKLLFRTKYLMCKMHP